MSDAIDERDGELLPWQQIHERAGVDPMTIAMDAKANRLTASGLMEAITNYAEAAWYVARSSSPPASPATGPIPQTALYWLGCAKDESHSTAERLFYMENAYNHVVNALVGRSSPATATPQDEECPCGTELDAGGCPNGH